MKDAVINQIVKEMARAFDEALEQGLEYSGIDFDSNSKEYIELEAKITEKFLERFGKGENNG